MSRSQKIDKFWEVLFSIIAITCIGILFCIKIFLLKEGLPILKVVSLKDFLFGKYWYPTSDPPDFGIFPLIVASFAVTLLSGIIAIPLSIATAVFMSEYASQRVRNILKPMFELLASLPSVILGLFGIVVVAPILEKIFDIPTGLNLFNASIMLAIMSIPIISSIAEDAIFAVPMELREASYALGATKMETIIRVVIPAALPGISAAIILGMSRAIGETMVVLMVAGGAAMIPYSIFDPVRPMPAAIAAEMGEAPAGTPHYHALFAIGVVLFVLTLLFNILAYCISQRYKQTGAATL